MKNALLKLSALTLTLIISHSATAQRYSAGDIVENVSLVDRSTGQEIELYDLEGKVIFLEWFAYWCPFCEEAAAQISPQIVDYYSGETTTGAEFIHVGVNIQGNAEQSTQSFVDFHDFGLVLNDFDRSLRDRFGSGQPVFAIINGLNNSKNHEQWELLYSNSGFGNITDPIKTFRTSIDSVAPLSELANISTRGRVGQGDNILIGGFVVEGTENQTVLIQGVGPELATLSNEDPLTPNNILSNPQILLINAAGEQIAFNDNWESEDAAAKSDAMTIAGSFTLPSGSQSAAILTDLAPGSYTVLVSGVDNTEGIALVEAYEVNPSTQANHATLLNISTRGHVASGDNVLIGGFVVEGALPQTVLIQGVGPELAALSEEDALTPINTLSNPNLLLVDAQGNIIETNDDWASANAPAKATAMAQTGSFTLPENSSSAAILKELAPGAYTVLLSGIAGDGIALIEAYQVPDQGL